jgi:hypothetical protein
MSLSSSEQLAASAAFDGFIEATNNILLDPAVVAHLGEIASEVQRVSDTAFLPNIRNGRFEIPMSQKGNDNLAIVPLTDEQADNAYEITALLNTEPPVRAWFRQEAVKSSRYGLELADELDAFFQEGPPGAANAPALKGLRNGTTARTAAIFGCTPDGLYWVSRPNLMIRSRLLELGSLVGGATVAHETIHVADLLEDGPLYGTLTYGGATELRAYHVGAAIYRVTGIDTPDGRDSIWLDSVREQEIGNTTRPFTPNSALMDTMIRTGKI